MANTVAIVIDGVLRAPVGEGLIDSGVKLYHSLLEHTRVALIADEVELDKVQHWLKVNGLTKHPVLVGAKVTDPEGDSARRLKQIARLREAQSYLDFLVEPDPQVAADCLQNGVPVLLALHPKYSRPDHRPDFRGAITPWGALVSEVERQAELRETDNRDQEIL